MKTKKRVADKLVQYLKNLFTQITLSVNKCTFLFDKKCDIFNS